jgi:hypothetical protein
VRIAVFTELDVGNTSRDQMFLREAKQKLTAANQATSAELLLLLKVGKFNERGLRATIDTSGQALNFLRAKVISSKVGILRNYR